MLTHFAPAALTYGHAPLKATAHGQGNPCRHCLNLIAEGDTKLVLAHRPFDEAHATQLAS